MISVSYSDNNVIKYLGPYIKSITIINIKCKYATYDVYNWMPDKNAITILAKGIKISSIFILIRY